MFENLTEKLGNVFSSLKKRGALTEKHVDEALKEVRLAVLEGDVSLPISKVSKVSNSWLLRLDKCNSLMKN